MVTKSDQEEINFKTRKRADKGEKGFSEQNAKSSDHRQDSDP